MRYRNNFHHRNLDKIAFATSLKDSTRTLSPQAFTNDAGSFATDLLSSDNTHMQIEKQSQWVLTASMWIIPTYVVIMSELKDNQASHTKQPSPSPSTHTCRWTTAQNGNEGHDTDQNPGFPNPRQELSLYCTFHILETGSYTWLSNPWITMQCKHGEGF